MKRTHQLDVKVNYCIDISDNDWKRKLRLKHLVYNEENMEKQINST